MVFTRVTALPTRFWTYSVGSEKILSPRLRRCWIRALTGVPGLICSAESPYISAYRLLQNTTLRSLSKTTSPSAKLSTASASVGPERGGSVWPAIDPHSRRIR